MFCKSTYYFGRAKSKPPPNGSTGPETSVFNVIYFT